jgi:quinol monooxygenase YgiN
MPFTVIAKVTCKPGHETEVETACAEMAAKVRQEPDTLTYIMLRSRKNPSVIMVYEVYKDEAAFDFHSKTPYMADLFAKLHGRTESVEVETLTEIARK